MSTPRFDLVDIAQTLRDKRKQVGLITLAIAVLGVAFLLIRKDKYQAKSDIFVNNPLYADRNNIFRDEMRFVDYFGGDDDIDRLSVIAVSDTVREMVARDLDLYKAYSLNPQDPEDRGKLREIFRKNYKLKRTEYTSAEVFFKDTDPERAAAVVNLSVTHMEGVFRGYYIQMREKVIGSLERKIEELDQTIVQLTDSLGSLRTDYGIYDILSPGRENLILSSVKMSGKPGFGRAMEHIQNVSSIKDQLVIDRAKYLTILNEFSTGNDVDEANFIQVVTPAHAPTNPHGPGTLMSIIIILGIGVFFSAIYILLRTYYQILIEVQR